MVRMDFVVPKWPWVRSKVNSALKIASELPGGVQGKVKSATNFIIDKVSGDPKGQETAATEKLEETEEIEDPDLSFQNACKAAHEHLQNLIKDGFRLPVEEIAATFQHLERKEVVFSAHGRHNCGKSTLLNALLDDSLLPTSLANETGVEVKIKHSQAVHEGVCPKGLCEGCPGVEVSWDNGKLSSAQGSEGVKEILKRANKSSRSTDSEADARCPQKAVKCTLTANVPILDAKNGWQVSLLDNPGFGESSQEKLMQQAEATLNTSEAFLYIMDAGQLNDKEDAHYLELISNKGVFDDSKRFMIIVTQFDKTFAEEDEWSRERVHEMVCREKVLKEKNVPPEAIVPVCGRWAVYAKQLKKSPTDRIRSLVKIALQSCPTAPAGQTENLDQLDATVLADRLLDVTGMKEIEERVRRMTSECICTWVNSLTERYLSYLNTATDQIDAQKQQLTSCQTCTEESQAKVLKSYTKVESIATNLQKNADLDQSDVFQRLLEGCREDVVDTNKSIQERLSHFKKECNDKVVEKSENFGPRELIEKMQHHLELNLTSKLCSDINKATGFQKGLNALTVALKKMTKKIETMKTSAIEFLEFEDEALRPLHNESATTQSDKQDEGQSEVQIEENQDEQEELSDEQEEPRDQKDAGVQGAFSGRKLSFEDFGNKVKVPLLQDTFWQRFGKGVWWTFSMMTFKLIPAPLYSYQSANCMDDAMKEFTEYVDEAVRVYLEGIETSVAKVFFADYQHHTGSYLNSFEKDYRRKLEDRKRTDEGRLRNLHAHIEVLAKFKNKVDELRRKLTSKSDKYKDALRMKSSVNYTEIRTDALDEA